MEDILVATLITEGGKLLSELIRSNQASKFKTPAIQYPVVPDELPGFSEGGGGPRFISSEVKVIEAPKEAFKVIEAPGEKVATSCVGCAIGHLATVTGLLNEAVRFVPEGMASPHIITNLNICLNELNAMERVDLAPDRIVDLPEWERELAHKALAASRETRHFIEAGILDADQMEKLAAYVGKVREEIGSAWLQEKLRAISKEDKEEIQRRVMAKLKDIGEVK
jgi:hypothetical protein